MSLSEPAAQEAADPSESRAPPKVVRKRASQRAVGDVSSIPSDSGLTEAPRPKRRRPVVAAEPPGIPSCAEVMPYPADREALGSDAALVSGAVRAGRYALIPALGNGALLGLRLCDAPITSPDPYRALVLYGSCGPLELCDGVRLLLALTGIDLGDSALEMPQSKWLTAAILGRLATTPLAVMTSIARGTLPPDHVSIPLRMTLRSSTHAFAITARASSACWLDFLSRGQWLREQLQACHFDAVPVAVPILIGCHTMPCTMLDEVAPGDILIPDTLRFDHSGRGLLQVGHWRLTAEYVPPGGIAITSLEANMDEATAPQKDAADAEPNRDEVLLVRSTAELPDKLHHLFDTVPVTLQFEMGRLHTTLGQLRTMAAGTILPIDGGSPAVISVRAGERAMGQGELVDVNGRLAIRIIHWG